MCAMTVYENPTYTEVVTQLYKDLGSIEAVSKQLPGLSRRVISEIVSTIPNRESYRRRGKHWTIPSENLIRGLQRAAQELGEPLSGLRYQQIAPELGLPAYNTVVRRYGSWQKACKAAGVECNPPRGRRNGAFTEEQCIEAVRQCIEELGDRPSYEAYQEWASVTEGVPSGPTVRNLMGWGAAVMEALS